MTALKRLALLLLVAAAPPARAGEGSSTVTITLTQAAHGGGRVYVPVRFGNVMGAMRLDTGASTSRIKLAPWNKDLPILGQSDSTGALGKVTRCEDVQATNVALKAEQGNNIARAKYDVTRCAASDGDDLLGLDFFKGARFTLDFERREMVFFGPQMDGRPVLFQPLGPDQRLVGISIRAGTAKSLGLFDTGAEISAVDQQFVERHRGLFAPVESKFKASEASGGGAVSRIYKIKTLDLGDGRVLRNVHALVYDFGALREALGPQTAFVLGVNILSRFNWALDFTKPTQASWIARPRKP
ncbi:aspartyl protease family protein [Methylocystis echinoides]|uniref:aspartyl protease family protein n=1 Tax=Methylocystis echinoides TaxID=29468 RepID=UPI00342FF4A9